MAQELTCRWIDGRSSYAYGTANVKIDGDNVHVEPPHPGWGQALHGNIDISLISATRKHTGAFGFRARETSEPNGVLAGFLSRCATQLPGNPLIPDSPRGIMNRIAVGVRNGAIPPKTPPAPNR